MLQLLRSQTDTARSVMQDWQGVTALELARKECNRLATLLEDLSLSRWGVLVWHEFLLSSSCIRLSYLIQGEQESRSMFKQHLFLHHDICWRPLIDMWKLKAAARSATATQGAEHA